MRKSKAFQELAIACDPTNFNKNNPINSFTLYNLCQDYKTNGDWFPPENYYLVCKDVINDDRKLSQIDTTKDYTIDINDYDGSAVKFK